jgi:hypothetical protein
VGPFLGRFNAALDRHAQQRDRAEDAADRAESVRELSDFLHRELVALRSVPGADAQLQQAHDKLVSAIDELALALDQQATALTLGDPTLRVTSIKRRSEAWNRWSAAFAGVVARCDAEVGD